MSDEEYQYYLLDHGFFIREDVKKTQDYIKSKDANE